MALLCFSLSFPTFSFRFASHLRNIIWFEIQHFPLCHVLGGAAHALCRSLISIHSLLKCSSIHLERMLKPALRVERMLLNECWQRQPPRQQNPLYPERLQTVSHCFYCFWRGVGHLTHTYPVLTLQITYQAKTDILTCAAWIWNVTSLHTDTLLMYKSLFSCSLSTLLSVRLTSSDWPSHLCLDI